MTLTPQPTLADRRATTWLIALALVTTALVSAPPPAAAAPAAPAGSAYEMVTPANKTHRRGAHCARLASFWGLDDLACPNPALASPDGDRVMYGNFASAVDPDAGTAISGDRAPVAITRSPTGWVGKAVLSAPPVVPGTHDAGLYGIKALSADLSAAAMRVNATPFTSGSRAVLWLLGDVGGVAGSGIYDWNPLSAATGFEGTSNVVFNADGSRMVGGGFSWEVGGNLSSGRWHGLLDDSTLPGIEDPSVTQVGGRTHYLSEDPGEGPQDLIGECSGSSGGPDATVVPQRVGSGAPDDDIGLRSCGAGELTSKYGTALAPDSVGPPQGTLASDARRVFFMSPTPGVAGVPDLSVAGCTGAVGAASSCQPQVFVRQYAATGEATVRWISRPDPAIGTQDVGMLGGGAYFQGASTDGRVAYFTTNAPLVVDDPNGGDSITAGEASHDSWDLYRYVLPDGGATDPGDGSLTRISGGPSGGDDPSVNHPPIDGKQLTRAVRHVSDDGSRVYFVTTAPIEGADNAAPIDGTTTPGGAVGNQSSRNLYLYDDSRAGAERWQFVARLPTAAAPVDACATLASASGFTAELGGGRGVTAGGCVRGTHSGDAVVFETTGQLVAGDSDAASDIYLYDADADRIVRITHPGAQQAYVCGKTGGPNPEPDPGQRCNGDLGVEPQFTSGVSAQSAFGGMEHYNLAETPDGELDAVYFESALALDPADVNDRHMDTYEWRDGGVTLVSPGDAEDHAFYSGNSTDGSSVFFETTQAIDPREQDPADHDVYVARVGGGFPFEPPGGLDCDVLADECQGGGAAPASRPLVDSDRVADGDLVPGARIRLSAGVSKSARRRAARTGVLAVRIRRSVAGEVRVIARARLGGRARRIAAARRRLSAGSVTTVRLRLDSSARRRLRSGRALRAVVAVSSPGAHTRTLGTTLKRGVR